MNGRLFQKAKLSRTGCVASDPAQEGARAKAAPIAKGRFPGADRVFCFGHARLEAATGGPIAFLKNGDIVALLDARKGALDAALSGDELTARGAERKPRGTDDGSGAIWKYTQTAGSAGDRSVTRSGGQGETHCHADM